jgi:predicted nucleic acid-binding protein
MVPISEAIDGIIEHDLTVDGICREVDDDTIFACAFVADVDHLAAGDSDLPEIGESRTVRIVIPRDFEALFM